MWAVFESYLRVLGGLFESYLSVIWSFLESYARVSWELWVIFVFVESYLRSFGGLFESYLRFFGVMWALFESYLRVLGESFESSGGFFELLRVLVDLFERCLRIMSKSVESQFIVLDFYKVCLIVDVFYLKRILLERRHFGAYFRGKARRPLIIIGALLPRCQSHSRRREFVPLSDACDMGKKPTFPRQRQESLQNQLFKSRLLHWIWAERLLVWDSVGSLLKTMVVYWIIGFYYILLLLSIDCNVPGWWLKTKVESHVKASSWIRSSWWFIVDILWRKQMQKHTHWHICCSTWRGFIPIPNQLRHLGRWQTHLNCQL